MSPLFQILGVHYFQASTPLWIMDNVWLHFLCSFHSRDMKQWLVKFLFEVVSRIAKSVKSTPTFVWVIYTYLYVLNDKFDGWSTLEKNCLLTLPLVLWKPVSIVYLLSLFWVNCWCAEKTFDSKWLSEQWQNAIESSRAMCRWQRTEIKSMAWLDVVCDASDSSLFATVSFAISNFSVFENNFENQEIAMESFHLESVDKHDLNIVEWLITEF